MENRIAVFTIFTFLLFAVSTARIALDQVAAEYSTESVNVADSDVVLPNESLKSELDETTVTDRVPESEKTQTLDVSAIDPMVRLRFARLHPINRHFDKTSRIPLRLGRRHPCRKFQKALMNSRTVRSYGNDMILSENTFSFDPKAIGDQAPTKWLEFKHHYGHRHHHEHHHDRDEGFVAKHMFDRENMLSSSHHRKEKREHKGGFMRRFRKFLKHTFD